MKNKSKSSRVKTKDNPQLKERLMANGEKAAYYLEYYLGRTQEPRLDENGNPMFYQSGKMAGKPMYIVTHDRKKEELKLYRIIKPKTPQEKAQNDEDLALAQSIRREREQERLNDVMGYRVNTHKNDNVISFFESYLTDYSKKDRRNISLAINRFKTFLREYRPACATKKAPREIESIKEEWETRHKDIPGKHEINENAFYRFTLKPGQLNKELVKQFVEYLKENSEGEGAATAYARFKKIVKSAYEKGILVSNPCEGIRRPPIDKDSITKDILTPDEMAALINTHYAGENQEIRRAFIFTLYTGVRWCDVRELRYNNVDYPASFLKFTQKKTDGHSTHAEVIMPLRADLLQLIGTPSEGAENDLIFRLPSHTMCNKALGRWTARAGIKKHITWHCGRHSFATNILTNGANIKVVADLLGHSGLQYVTKYARAIDEAKKTAIDSLPGINL